jgi:hypothetical protein
VKPQEDVSPEDVINAFAKEYSSVNVDEIFGLDCDYNTGRQLSREFIARTGLVRKTPQVKLSLLVFFCLFILFQFIYLFHKSSLLGVLC